MPKTTDKRNPNQRSYHLDEETVALLDGYAHKNALSQSAALRVLIRQVLGGDAVPPVNQSSFSPAGQKTYTDAAVQQVAAPVAASGAAVEGTGIVMPPDGQETFRVPEKFREKGGRPRPKHEDDDF